MIIPSLTYVLMLALKNLHLGIIYSSNKYLRNNEASNPEDKKSTHRDSAGPDTALMLCVIK